MTIIERNLAELREKHPQAVADAEKAFQVLIGDGLSYGEVMLLELRLATKGWLGGNWIGVQRVTKEIYQDLEFALLYDRYHKFSQAERAAFDQTCLLLAKDFVDSYEQKQSIN